MGFTVRFLLGAVLVFLCLNIKSTNGEIEETTQTANTTEETPKPKTDSSIDKNVSSIVRLQKSETYKKATQPQRSLDIEKFVSQEFHNKNNVYQLPISPDTEKFINSDYDYHSTPDHHEFAFNSELTTPKTMSFDNKFKETVESVEQKLEHIDDSHESEESESKENINLEKLYEETKNNETKADLNYLNYQSIIKNDTTEKNNLHKDLVLEAGTNLDFQSSYNKTIIIDEDDSKNNEASTISNKIKGELPDKPEAFTVKSTSLTTRKSIVLTKPPSSRNSSHISILSNNIETETVKAVNTVLTTTGDNDIIKRGSVKYSDYAGTVPTTAVDNTIDKRAEQLLQENQLVPVHVEAPPVAKNNSVTETTVVEEATTAKAEEVTTAATPTTTTTSIAEDTTTATTPATTITSKAEETTSKAEETTSKAEETTTATTPATTTTSKAEEATIATTPTTTTTAEEVTITTTSKAEEATITTTPTTTTTEDATIATTPTTTTTAAAETTTIVGTTTTTTTTIAQHESELATTIATTELETVIVTTMEPSTELPTATEIITVTEPVQEITTTTATDQTSTIIPETTTAEIDVTTQPPSRTSKAVVFQENATTTEIPSTTTAETTEPPARTSLRSITTTTTTTEAATTVAIPKTTSDNIIIENRTILFRILNVTDTTTTEIDTTDSSEATSDSLGVDNNDSPGDNSGTIAAIVISCVAAVCLVLLAGLLFVMRKRQKRFNYGQRCTPVSLDDYSMDNVSVLNSVRRKGMVRNSKRSYGNPAFEDPVSVTHPLNFPALGKFATNFEDIRAEFEEIPLITARTNELPEGCDTKNRYANVIPLPETRVFLTPIDGYPNSDYINANYVSGPKNTKGYYIACQAPLQNTVDDFWRMVWEQQCKVILMLTHLFENGVEKCVDYLPPSEVLDCHRLFGDFQVTLKKREVKDKYIISILQLKNMVSNSWRDVTHFWYLGWPEKGVPIEGNSLIAFLIEARSYMKSSSIDRKDITNGNLTNGTKNELNPVVVHCSPGTGRTGVVIACDIAIREFEQTRLVDVPRIVYKIRRDRASAVQTKEQYAFIYKVINLYATKLTGGALDSL